MDIRLAHLLAAFNYYFYLKKFPLINRIDITPFIDNCGYDIVVSEYIWDDLVYLLIDKSKTTVVFGICTSFIRNMEWWGEGGNLDIFPVIKYKNLGIHNGFYTMSQKILDHPIMDVLRSFHKDGKQIILTGHSRGAGIASCIAIKMLYEFNINVSLYTFGEPRSLYTYPQLQEITNTNVYFPDIKKFRFITQSDLVTGLGFDMGSHWGQPFLLLDDLCCPIDKNNYPDTVQFNLYVHLPSNYLNIISNILKDRRFTGISSIQYYSYIPLKTILYASEKLIFSYNYITSYDSEYDETNLLLNK